MKNLKYSNRGFTLIEVAVVVLILSFLLIPLFNFMTQQKMQQNAIEAEVVNERVLAALALYVKNNGKMPCPANPAIPYGEEDFAHAECSDSSMSPVTGIIRGDIPTATLGIPYRLMVNQAGWKYIYWVVETETAASTYTGSGDLTIVDHEDNELIDGGVGFVIVNPGKDGKGARTIYAKNSPVLCNASANNALDYKNCDNDKTFVDAPQAPLPDPRQNGFYDDIIFYDMTREESTMWMMSAGTGTSGAAMDIINRNQGRVGIGVTDAIDSSAKLEVDGGNVKVSDGNVAVGQSVTAGANIHAEGEVIADQLIKAKRFVYDE